MPVQRKVFRIEENARATVRGAAPAGRNEPAPQLDAYLSEIKALRALLEPQLPASRDTLERARAQIAEVEAYRGELAAIHTAIEGVRSPMDVLDRAVLRESQFERAARELEAIVAGTEQATQSILRAVEAIDEAARALPGATDGAERQKLAGDIGEHASRIFQACNFQDLTGQRTTNVLATLQAIEAQVARLVQIWRRIGQFQPVVFEEPQDDRRFLNGPKLPGDTGHWSQADIDTMFGSKTG